MPAINPTSAEVAEAQYRILISEATQIRRSTTLRSIEERLRRPLSIDDQRVFVNAYAAIDAKRYCITSTVNHIVAVIEGRREIFTQHTRREASNVQ